MTTVSTARREVSTTLSSARFAVRNLGINTVTGTVPISSAWVGTDTTGVPVDVHATLDLGSLDTGNPRRDRDLRKPSLLDLDRHPTLVFSGHPEQSDRGWSVAGTIEAHGTSTPVTLDASVTDSPDGSMTVQASGELDRRDLGVRAPRLMIGHRIRIQLDVTIGRARQQR